MSDKRVNILVSSGAVADELIQRGLVNDRNMLSATALVGEHQDLVLDVHRDFLKAGATHLVTTNYHVVPGLGFTNEEIVQYTRQAGRLAQEARRAQGDSTAQEVTICGSLPPLLPSYRSDRTIDKATGEELYLLIAESLWPFVDAYVAETMSSLAEAKIAYCGVAQLKKPVFVSFALSRDGAQLRSGEDVAGAVERLIQYSMHLARELNEENVLRGILFDCSQPEDIAKALKYLQESPAVQDLLQEHGITVGGCGDRVSPSSTAGELEEKLVAGAMHSDLDLEIFSRFAAKWVEFGAQVVGGCRGISPRYVGHVAKTLSTNTVQP